MKTTNIIISLSILIAVYSCKQAEAPAEEAPISPISTFDSPFPKNNKKLSNILGSVLTLKTEYGTSVYKIISTKKDNLIINETGDTIFFGSVCKYRDFYFLNEKLSDTAYYISAIKIKGNLIYGLNNSLQQFIEVDNNIIKGNNKKLVKYTAKDTSMIRLHPDKKELRNLFTTIISTVIPDTILNFNKTYYETLEKKELISELEQDENNNIKVYPNPTTDFINVELKQKSKSSFQISDINGRTILQGKLNELINKIELNNQRAGIYLLTIINSENNETETKKIVIK